MPPRESKAWTVCGVFSGILLMLTAASCSSEKGPYQLTDDVAMYKRELRALPDDINARYQLGVTYYKLGDYSAAAKELEDVVRENPNLPYAYNNLGLAYVGMGELGKAITAYLKALELDRDFLTARLNAGLAYYLAGEFGSWFTLPKAVEEGPRQYWCAPGPWSVSFPNGQV